MLYRECFRLLNEDPPWLHLYNYQTLAALSPRMGSWRLPTHGIIDVRGLPAIRGLRPATGRAPSGKPGRDVRVQKFLDFENIPTRPLEEKTLDIGLRLKCRFRLHANA